MAKETRTVSRLKADVAYVTRLFTEEFSQHLATRMRLAGVEGKLAASTIPMLLSCPQCHTRHVDAGEFATKPHHTHACQNCGMVWRPAIQNTVGVQYLPGFKD